MGKDPSVILNNASDGAPSGSERVKEWMEYTPQGLVLSGTCNGPLMEARVSNGSTCLTWKDESATYRQARPLGHLEIDGTYKVLPYIYCHMYMWEQWPDRDKETQGPSSRACKLCRASKCHQIHEPPVI